MADSDTPIPLVPITKPAAAEPSPRLSVLEIAARRGIGPLSSAGSRVWHGDARPCVSCGQLVPRDASECDECGQDLSDEMLKKMQEHSGPWYVHEHVRPFPGVTLERLIRQIRRGVLNRSTVVRGPTTYHQWRFAAETPGLSKYLGCCWVCQAEADPRTRSCPSCGVDLDGGFDLRDVAGSQPPEVPREGSAALQQLSSAVTTATRFQPRHRPEETLKILGVPVTWLILILFVLTVAGVFALVQLRTDARTERGRVSSPAAPADVAPPEPAESNGQGLEREPNASPPPAGRSVPEQSGSKGDGGRDATIL